jgi:hypothetical protein
MPSDEPARKDMGILVSLDVLVRSTADGPRAIETTASALERLRWVGRPVVLASSAAADRRLPADPDERVRWTRHILADEAVEVVPFEAPMADRRGDDGEVVERWRMLRDAHRARWLIESGWPIATARRAGLTVIEIGGRTASMTDRPDHDARDLLDATNQLLMTETFRPAESI